MKTDKNKIALKVYFNKTNKQQTIVLPKKVIGNKKEVVWFDTKRKSVSFK